MSAVDGDYLRQDSQDTYASGTLWGGVVGLGSHSRYFGQPVDRRLAAVAPELAEAGPGFCLLPHQYCSLISRERV
ncbi:hypothetical protein [Serratia symbiotica]|uniref:hypothetical protein n=1 Tax=Serratia symbiotica TaxID=138074 RepID=UPI003D9A4422